MIKALTGVAVFVTVNCCPAMPAPVAATLPGPAYTAVVNGLRQSVVPVLLPIRLPREAAGIAAVALIEAGPNGYYVGFSKIPHCNGALSCTILHVAGYPRSSQAGRTYGNDRPIALPDGSRGYYSARDCSGSSCTEASLTFARDRNVYEIDAKIAPDDLPVLKRIYSALKPLASLRGASRPLSKP